jgi:2-hydroxymuconate-semialdehyde hydrolase
MADLTSDVFADWFRALLDATCEDRPILIAHSLLGALATRYAIRDRDSLQGLVIYAAPGIGPYRVPLRLMILATRFGLRPSEKNAERFFDFDAAKRQNQGWLEAWSAYTRERAAVPHVKRTMRRLIKSCTKRIPDDELRRIEVPITLIWGSHDRFVPLGLAEGASARLGWPLRMIDEAGHVPHIERTEAFLEALVPTLARPSRSPAPRSPRRDPRSPSAPRS